jgi:hypothetical protein
LRSSLASVWIDTSAGNAYILVDGVPGAAVWKLITEAAPLYAIGDTGPAGGIVFYITDGGTKGYEAAPVDQGAPEWGCDGVAIPGADRTDIDAGSANTADILAGCATPGIAARFADTYSLNGFNDWFLPSKDQLNELYMKKDVVGGFASNDYWSSTEYNDDSAWSQFFGNANQNNNNKGIAYGVRAVRAF